MSLHLDQLKTKNLLIQNLLFVVMILVIFYHITTAQHSSLPCNSKYQELHFQPDVQQKRANYCKCVHYYQLYQFDFFQYCLHRCYKTSALGKKKLEICLIPHMKRGRGGKICKSPISLSWNDIQGS